MSESTFEITNSMKAVGIMAVIAGHYSNSHISYDLFIPGNGLLVIFFFLSGYGLFNSLSKYDSLGINNVARFWEKRALRIYPLFFLSFMGLLALDFVFGPFGESAPGRAFQSGILVFAGQISALPFLHQNYFYKWFIYFIVQCYILGPLIYASIRKYSKVFTFLASGAILTATNLILFSAGYEAVKHHYGYRNIFFSHIFIFSLGMMAPEVIEKLRNSHRQDLLAPGIFALSAFSIFGVYFTRASAQLSTAEGIAGALINITAFPALCALLILWNPSNALTRALDPLGKHVYVIYLFNNFYFYALDYAGLIKQDSLFSILTYLAFFPLFFKFVAEFEEAYSRAVSELISR